MFSRFYRLPSLDCLLRKAWGKKIPERSEDDFLSPTKPLKGAALQQIMRQSKTFAA